ncbi:MAG: nucleoside recognition domain-containing protein [Deferrisomatales bacterium]|nr:nucleoside recognition domain-containing protein [Deferrisomatales bacterium]
MDATPPLLTSVHVGLRHGLSSVLILSRVMIPVYVAVDLLRDTPALGAVAGALQPAMSVFGLPGEAAMVLVAGFFINLYAAIGALVPLGLGPREVTILGLMLGLAHGLILETAIIRQVGTRWLSLALARLLLSVVAGAAVHRVLP